MSEFYKQFIGPEDTVFDIGANIGERSEVFSGICQRVIAVEPVDESFEKLKRRFSSLSGRIEFVHKACGAKIERDMIATSSAAPTTGAASMSPLWIEAVSKSKRFGFTDHWNKFQVVEVTTLDALIKEFGVPAFIKIDVEGYEKPVLTGLSKSVKSLSFEFTPERICEAIWCVLLCEQLDMKMFNLSIMERFELGTWTDAIGIIRRLSYFQEENVLYGDVYAKR